MITIFTPSYNRGNDLKNLYKSLCNQTDKDFIWYIIDDGSTDNTIDIIKQFKKDNQIRIEFYMKENGGKHSAFNTLFETCKTKYFICVDSDDYLGENAIEIINNTLLKSFNENIWGIVGPRAKHNGQTYSKWVLDNNKTIKFCELYSKYKYIGDTYIIIDINKLNGFRFPIYADEKLVPENILYDYLDKNYFVKSSSYIFYFSEYQDDGYTKNGTKMLNNSPNGICDSNISSFQNKYNSFKIRLFSYCRYMAIKKVFNIKRKAVIVPSIKNYFIIFIGTMLYPIFYYHYRRKKV